MIRNTFDDRPLQYVDPRVDGVPGDLILRRFLGKPQDASVGRGLDQTVSSRIHDPGHDDGRVGVAFPMVLDYAAQVGVSQHISVEHNRGFVDQVSGASERPGSSPREILVSVTHRDAVVETVAEDVFDLARLVGQAEDYLGDLGALDVVDLKKEKRDVGQGNDGFWRVQGQRTQSRPFPARKNECLDHDPWSVEKHKILSQRSWASVVKTAGILYDVGMRFRGFQLVRVWGIPIVIDYSWFLVFFLVSYTMSQGYFPQTHKEFTTSQYWMMGMITAFLVFVSVLVHELSHSFVALKHGVRVSSIRLFFRRRRSDRIRTELGAPRVPDCSRRPGHQHGTLFSLRRGLRDSDHPGKLGTGRFCFPALVGCATSVLALFNLDPWIPSRRGPDPACHSMGSVE